jgi:hypothetical protein
VSIALGRHRRLAMPRKLADLQVAVTVAGTDADETISPNCAPAPEQLLQHV